jgi:BirA family biotin operon repressor/biotin-[acetyl-CoA-carboxylase] ligase
MKSNPDIIWLDVAESSNDVARKAIDSLDNLSVVAARCQTKGRGQRTNTWETAPGQNLTFTIVLKDFEIHASSLAQLSWETAQSVVKFLGKYGISARIKLPNDVYVGEKKICGILIENCLKGQNLQWSIIGIGINVYQTDFPEWLPNPTSMVLEGYKKEIPLEVLLEEFISVFTKRITLSFAE